MISAHEPLVLSLKTHELYYGVAVIMAVSNSPLSYS